MSTIRGVSPMRRLLNEVAQEFGELPPRQENTTPIPLLVSLALRRWEEVVQDLESLAAEVQKHDCREIGQFKKQVQAIKRDLEGAKQSVGKAQDFSVVQHLGEQIRSQFPDTLIDSKPVQTLFQRVMQKAARNQTYTVRGPIRRESLRLPNSKTKDVQLRS